MEPPLVFIFANKNSNIKMAEVERDSMSMADKHGSVSLMRWTNDRMGWWLTSALADQKWVGLRFPKSGEDRCHKESIQLAAPERDLVFFVKLPWNGSPWERGPSMPWKLETGNRWNQQIQGNSQIQISKKKSHNNHWHSGRVLCVGAGKYTQVDQENRKQGSKRVEKATWWKSGKK